MSAYLPLLLVITFLAGGHSSISIAASAVDLSTPSALPTLTNSSSTTSPLSSPTPSAPSFTTSLPEVLAVDEAFILSALIELPNTVVIMWEIKEGYYIYHKSLKFNEINTSHTQNPQIPGGEHITDEFFGDVEVFYNKLLVRIPYTAATQEIILDLNYQGCAEAGFCYPMQQKQIRLEVL